jgi:hypothetical protein
MHRAGRSNAHWWHSPASKFRATRCATRHSPRHPHHVIPNPPYFGG